MEHTSVVIADDFTGAAESAMQWRAAGVSAAVHLGSDTASPDTLNTHRRVWDQRRVDVFDTHTRQLNAEDAAEVVGALLRTLPSRSGLLFKKIDSLWRGNVGPELQALRTAGYRLVIAGALPDLERTVVGGKPLVHGVPLRDAGLWTLETDAEPESVVQLFPSLSLTAVDLAAVRSPAGPASQLAAALRREDGVIVDGETDSDLTAVARAVLALSRRAGDEPVALIGTGAMARALVGLSAVNGALHVQAPLESNTLSDTPARPVLTVVGSASPAAREQIDALRNSGVPVFGLHEADKAGIALGARAGIAALVVADMARRDTGAVLREVAAAVQHAISRAPDTDLALTGGETARTLLNALGVKSLEPLRQVQHGVVISLADDGRLVAAKPGSFGTADIFIQVIHLLRVMRSASSSQENP